LNRIPKSIDLPQGKPRKPRNRPAHKIRTHQEIIDRMERLKAYMDAYPLSSVNDIQAARLIELRWVLGCEEGE
jgi:hypothetical protein